MEEQEGFRRQLSIRSDLDSYRVFEEQYCDQIFGVDAPTRPPSFLDLDFEVIQIGERRIARVDNRGSPLEVERTPQRVARDRQEARYLTARRRLLVTARSVRSRGPFPHPFRDTVHAIRRASSAPGRRDSQGDGRSAPDHFGLSCAFARRQRAGDSFRSRPSAAPHSQIHRGSPRRPRAQPELHRVGAADVAAHASRTLR